jgi:hypothetical protein
MEIEKCKMLITGSESNGPKVSGEGLDGRGGIKKPEPPEGVRRLGSSFALSAARARAGRSIFG